MNKTDITIERCAGVKCPRCWRYCGIPGNPQSICDRCATALLSASAEDYHAQVRPEDIPQFDAAFTAFQAEIRVARRGVAA